MTTDLTMRVNVRTTTTSSGFTEKLVTVGGCWGMVNTSSIIFRVRTRDDATYVVAWLSCTMLTTSRIAGYQPQ